MKTNLQQAWQHQNHTKGSNSLHKSQSHRLVSPLPVKASYKLLTTGEQPCFNLSYYALIFLQSPSISSTHLTAFSF